MPGAKNAFDAFIFSGAPTPPAAPKLPAAQPVAQRARTPSSSSSSAEPRHRGKSPSAEATHRGKSPIRKESSRKGQHWQPKLVLMRQPPQHFRPGEIRTVFQPMRSMPISETEWLSMILGGGAGFSLREMIESVDHFPRVLRQATMDLAGALGAVMSDQNVFQKLIEPRTKMHRHLVSRLPVKKASRLVVPPEISGACQGLGSDPEAIAKLPFFVRLVDDDFTDYPYGQEIRCRRTSRRVGFAFNRKITHLWGLSEEELLSRLANSEMQMFHMTAPVDVVNCFIETLLGLLDISSPNTRVNLISKHGMHMPHYDKQGMFMRVYAQTEMDQDFTYHHQWLIPMTPDEFDFLKEQEPENCWPLIHAAGESRSARQLLQDHSRDRKITLKQLRQTSFLDRYGMALRDRVSAIMNKTHGAVMTAHYDAAHELSRDGSCHSDEFSAASTSPSPESLVYDDMELSLATSSPLNCDEDVGTPMSDFTSRNNSTEPEDAEFVAGLHEAFSANAPAAPPSEEDLIASIQREYSRAGDEVDWTDKLSFQESGEQEEKQAAGRHWEEPHPLDLAIDDEQLGWDGGWKDDFFPLLQPIQEDVEGGAGTTDGLHLISQVV